MPDFVRAVRRVPLSFGLAPLRKAAVLIALLLAIIVRPAAAQQILRDAETEALLADMSAPLIEAAGMDPRNVQILLINDRSINAFVAGGQIVWLHSGLILASDNANQVQGVIAHELGHIEGGHIIRSSEGARAATGISLISLILGAAAIAAGGGEAGMGILAAGQQAALGKYLAFSRTQESSADLAGARYLSAAGLSGEGSLAFFKKLQNMEFRLNIPQTDSYDRTHPLSGERIAVLREVYQKDPAWGRPTDPAIEARFQRVKAKLAGFVADPPETLRRYPLSDTSIPAHYARAYAYHKGAYPEQAVAEVDALIARLPNDPYVLELKGQVLLESGRPLEAIAPLRRAVELTSGQPLIAALLGHALIATDDPAKLDEAEQVLRLAVARDNDNPFAWYGLGTVFERKGDTPRAALATAERFHLMGNPVLAARNADLAISGVPEGSQDWLRAQDILLVSRARMEEGRRRR